MRNVLLAGSLLLLVSIALAADPPEMALVVVDGPAPGTAAALLEADVMVVREMQGYLLLAAEPAHFSQLDALGLRWRVLDASMAGNTYYTVGVGSEDHLSAIRPPARVLRYDGLEAVIAASPDEVEATTVGFEIARVFIRPIRLAPTRKPFPIDFLIPPDPQVQQMVDDVDGTAVNGYVQRLEDFGTRYSSHDSCAAAAQWLHDQFVSFGVDSVYFQHWSSTYNDNVVAVLPGTRNPEKVVVIGGHYDSTTGNQNVAPGADDDASGTACLLEVARVLAGYDLDNTVTCVAFCGEEQGLLGSEAYADQAAANGDEIIGVICVDMIGYLAGGDVLDLDIITNSSSQWMRSLVGEVATTYVPALPVVTGSLPWGASSDHASFWSAGFDALLFFEDTGDYSPFIHTADDIVGLSYNSPVLAESSVKIAVGLVATMAKAPPVVITHTPLGNTTDTQNPYPVVAQVVTTTTLNPDSLLVRYATGAGWNSLPLTATGNPDEYAASIPAQPGGTFVDYYVLAEDVGGYHLTHPDGAPAAVHTFFVGTITPVIEDDLEVASGWTVGDVGDDATTGIWERVDPNGTYSGTDPVQPEDDHTPAPGTICFATGQSSPGASQGVNDVDGGKTTVLSPLYDLSGYTHAGVRYHRWFTNDTGSAPGEDEWAVDVSADGGQNWVRIESTYESDRSWRPVEHFLPDYIVLTNQVKFRFIARDENSGSIVEAGVDDFALVTYEEPTTAVTAGTPAAGARITLGQNVPNPFNPETSIRLSIPAPERLVTLRIFDVSGRLVATLVDGESVLGERTVRWDGRSDSGQAATSGVYFMRLEVGDATLSRKIVLMQ